MERYNLHKDVRQFAIHKRWTTYAGRLLHGFWALIPLLFWVFLWQRDPRPTPILLPLLLLGLPLTVVLGCGAYLLWKLSTGGDTFVFDARTHLFEHNRHVVSHWDGIAQIQVIDVPHQRDKRGIQAMLNLDEYYYTYRLVVLLHNGKKYALDECGNKQTIAELAQEVAAYTNKVVVSDVANAGWFA